MRDQKRVLSAHDTIHRETRGNGHILDVTDDIRRVASESGVQVGQIDLDTRPRSRTITATVIGTG